MAKRNISWSGFNGTGADGTKYQINGERIRPEPREYWAEFFTGNRWVELPHPTESWATSRKLAAEAAEHHYATTHPDGDTA